MTRYLSRKDIHVIAACGCPSINRKVVNSGKRLRAYVGIDEGNVLDICLPTSVTHYIVILVFEIDLIKYNTLV